MKSRLALVLVLASSAVAAQELKVGDLNFFQKQGTFLFDTRFDHTEAEGKNKLAGVSNDFDATQTVWNNKLTYGLTDTLNVGLGLNYALKNEVDESGLGSYEDDGLSDLTLFGAYRANADTIFVDFNGAATLGILEREDSEINGKDGNFYQGHHSLNLGVALGAKGEKLEARMGLNLDYHFAGEYDSLGTDETIDTDGYLNLIMSGSVQYRFVDNFALAADIAYVNYGEQVEEDESNAKLTQEQYNQVNIGLTGKWNMTDNALLYVGYRSGSDAAINYKETGAQTKYSSQNTYYVGGTFLF